MARSPVNLPPVFYFVSAGLFGAGAALFAWTDKTFGSAHFGMVMGACVILGAGFQIQRLGRPA